MLIVSAGDIFYAIILSIKINNQSRFDNLLLRQILTYVAGLLFAFK